jgi:predicted MFS family arabinose efflux permease
VSPFRHRTYAVIWTATVVANIGTWMYSAAAAWLMTELDPHPLMVSLVQVAASLPVFLFALPAGALADIVDRRRLLILAEGAITVLSGAFAALVWLGQVTPVSLLVFTFLIEMGAAFVAPAWQSIVPQLVPRSELPAAVATNSVGINISRAVGPALGGVLTGSFGIAAPFWVNAFSNFSSIGALLWWRPPKSTRTRLPAERLANAIRTGLRHARHNPPLRATLLRAVGFFLAASAYWALLPLVARTQIGGGPELYGVLLAAIGAGAIGGALALSRLRAKLGADTLVAAATLGTAAALCLFGIARETWSALAASLLAGACWIAAVSNLNVSAQFALPEWVRGRGLAVYATVFFGAMTLGSALWGELASLTSLSMAHFIAAACAVAAIPLTRRWKLQTAAAADLSPSMHWPAPVLSQGIEHDEGPVLVTVEYRVVAQHRAAFLSAIEHLAAERRRDGAYAWGIFEDTAQPGRCLETFLVESWLEHLRQHERVTNADRVLEERVRGMLSEPPKITHLVTAG